MLIFRMKDLIPLKRLKELGAFLLIVVTVALPSEAQERAFREAVPGPESLAVGGVFQVVEEGPDGVIILYESTFNEMVQALKPIKISGSHPLKKKIRVCIPWTDNCWSETVKICDGNWTAEVDLHISITTSDVIITGNVTGTYDCVLELPFQAPIKTTGDVTYDAVQHAVSVKTNATSIKPSVHVPAIGEWVDLGKTIDVAPTLRYSIPVTTAHFHFETARGSDWVSFTPENISLRKKNGYIELKGDVVVW